MRDDIIASMAVSPARRLFAVGILWALAVMLVWMALLQPPSPLWQGLLVLCAAGAGFGGEALRRATRLSIILTEEGLMDSTGRPIAPLGAIRSVERGTFAFKPSNGFLLVLDRRIAPRVWAPGLWWRTGRRVGVGGTTSSHAARAMAEEIARRIAARAP